MDETGRWRWTVAGKCRLRKRERGVRGESKDLAGSAPASAEDVEDNIEKEWVSGTMSGEGG